MYGNKSATARCTLDALQIDDDYDGDNESEADTEEESLPRFKDEDDT